MIHIVPNSYKNQGIRSAAHSHTIYRISIMYGDATGIDRQDDTYELRKLDL